MKMRLLGRVAGLSALLTLCGRAAGAQEPPAAKASQPAAQDEWRDGASVVLTLKRGIELALQNSKEIQVAKIQASVADRGAQITKAQFLPNLYAGSGAGYSLGIPETPGGRAPSVFNVTYTEQVINEPLRGQSKEKQEQSKAQKIVLEDAKNSVITRTAMAYLELGKVRHSLELLRKEEESAEKILQVTLELVSVYRVLAEFNKYTQFCRTFERNNLNAGIDVRVPIFSAQAKAAIGLAQINLEAAKVNLTNKKTELTAEVRQKTRRVRERDAAKEVARLELQLAQQDVAVFQSQFGEGKLNLRQVERAKLEDNQKWMAELHCKFQTQQAQLEFLR